MNKAWEQNTDEMQDEELYALLDRAMETERLCVSEELIQKTLQRVAEEESTKVVSFDTARKKKLSPVKYAGVAAAALLVVFGARALGGQKFMTSDMIMEATERAAAPRNATEVQDKAAEEPFSTNSGALADDVYYSKSETLSDLSYGVPEEPAADAVESEVLTADSRDGNVAMTGTKVALSNTLSEALTGAGMAPTGTEAEYWELVVREESWEKALKQALAAGEYFEKELPQSGSYCYVLDCKDGSRRQIRSERPLEAIVCLETEKGTLWGLYGNGTTFYME